MDTDMKLYLDKSLKNGYTYYWRTHMDNPKLRNLCDFDKIHHLSEKWCLLTPKQRKRYRCLARKVQRGRHKPAEPTEPAGPVCADWQQHLVGKLDREINYAQHKTLTQGQEQILKMMQKLKAKLADVPVSGSRPGPTKKTTPTALQFEEQHDHSV